MVELKDNKHSKDIGPIEGSERFTVRVETVHL